MIVIKLQEAEIPPAMNNNVAGVSPRNDRTARHPRGWPMGSRPDVAFFMVCDHERAIEAVE